MHVVADFDFAGFGDRPPALNPVDLVLFKQEFDAFGVGRDDVVFVRQHLFPIDRLGLSLKAHGGEIMLGFVQHMGRVQQCLGRDAADVQAGAAQGVAPLNHSRFQAQLRATNGANVAAGAGTDDDDVVAGHRVFL